MTIPDPVSARPWTRAHAAILATFCLLVGVSGGWLIGGFRGATSFTSAKSSSVPAPPASPAPQTAPGQLRAAADSQAAPLLNRLKSSPRDPAVLTELGNIYYDAQQYPVAVDYYDRALDAKPADAAVRTDMATADWYMGQADLAISEFTKALNYSPGNPNALFNRGIVKWQGKKDAAGALADWQQLLTSDPSYSQKDKVQQLIAEVQKQRPSASPEAGRQK